MKKYILVLALMVLATQPLAHADCGYNDCSAGASLLRVTLFPTMLTIGVGQFDGREAYVEEVRDDAAAFVTGGQETAALKNSLDRIRAKTGTSASDSELVNEILK